MYKYYCILLLVTILCAETFGQSDWIRTNPGAGGALSTLVGTLDGDLLAASDLSGVYISSDDGAHWEVIGKYELDIWWSYGNRTLFG